MRPGAGGPPADFDIKDFLTPVKKAEVAWNWNEGGGIEKVFLLNSPWIKDITVVSRAQVRRAKLYYLRERTGKSARLKRKI